LWTQQHSWRNGFLFELQWLPGVWNPRAICQIGGYGIAACPVQL
jgi:hypothetical protein